MLILELYNISITADHVAAVDLLSHICYRQCGVGIIKGSMTEVNMGQGDNLLLKSLKHNRTGEISKMMMTKMMRMDFAMWLSSGV